MPTPLATQCTCLRGTAVFKEDIRKSLKRLLPQVYPLRCGRKLERLLLGQRRQLVMLEQVLMFTMHSQKLLTEHSEICSGNFFIESEGTDHHMIKSNRCKITLRLQDSEQNYRFISTSLELSTLKRELLWARV